MGSGYKNWIGVMDSGVGGISVLKRAIDALPHESFLYFGDSLYAPYGEKNPDWIRSRTSEIVDNLIDQGVKAVVIACNTATSAAGDFVRTQHPGSPIIGVEPALKPAAISPETGHILVMTTPVTIRLQKYQELYNKWSRDLDVSSVVCSGFAKRIEQGDLDADDLHELLESLIGAYRGKADGVVLGCTHYPFIHKQIRKILGDVPLFDGAFGTARHLARILEEQGIATASSQVGRVELHSSIDTPSQLALYDRFFNLPLETSEYGTR